MTSKNLSENPIIGTLNEGSLHAALKTFFAEPGDQFEVPIDGFVADISRDTKQGKMLIEIQTSSFAAMRKKLTKLLDSHQIKVIFPVAKETLIVKPGVKPRKSPKKETTHTIFKELVSIPELLTHSNLSFDVVKVTVKKIKEYDPKIRRKRGGFRTINTELDAVHETQHFSGINDFMDLLPNNLPPVFTTAHVAANAKIPRSVAQQMVYCFRHAGSLIQVGNTKAGKEYRIAFEHEKAEK